MEIIIKLFWSSLPAVLSGIILAVFNSRQKKRDVKRDEKDDAKEDSEKLKISLLLATAQLSRAVAVAIKRGYPNGEIEEGLEQYNDTIKKFRDFEREQLAKMEK